LLHKKNADQQQRGAIRGEKLLLPWWANFLSTGQQAHYPVSKDNKTPALWLCYNEIVTHARTNIKKVKKRFMR
jgi:hypothetical protein